MKDLTFDNVLDQQIYDRMSRTEKHDYIRWHNEEVERRNIVTQTEKFLINYILDIITTNVDKAVKEKMSKYINDRIKYEHENYMPEFARRAKIIRYIQYDAKRITLVDIALEYLKINKNRL